jgi:ABC-2 type transport system ATP-binding protein
VAREFVHDMDLLFLDEPTTGLDPKARRVILDYLKERARKGLTVFFTTHIMEEAEYLCDRIAVIDKGRILALDSVQALKDRFGGGTLIEITADEVSNAAVEAIRALAGVNRVVAPEQPEEPLRVSVETPSSVLPVLLEVLARNGCSVRGVSVKGASLEDAFIRMVSN